MIRALGLCVAMSGLVVAGCAHAPRTATGRSSLEAEANNTLAMMTARDPSLQPLMEQAAGYVVFPAVSQGGFIVGGAGGRGVVYEQGRPVGFAELSQASVGAQVGGQKFAELIIVRDPNTLARMKAGTFDFGGQASATAIRSGTAAATQFGDNGVAVFIQPEGGAMLNLSLTGQRIKFTG